MSRGVGDQAFLQFGEPIDSIIAHSQLDFGMSLQGSKAAAGRVEQDEIETVLLIEWQVVRRVELDKANILKAEPTAQFFHRAKAMRSQISGDDPRVRR